MITRWLGSDWHYDMVVWFIWTMWENSTCSTIHLFIQCTYSIVQYITVVTVQYSMYSKYWLLTVVECCTVVRTVGQVQCISIQYNTKLQFTEVQYFKYVCISIIQTALFYQSDSPTIFPSPTYSIRIQKQDFHKYSYFVIEK